jgi:hypothetical protein
MNRKSGEHVSGIKPLETPLLHRINQVIIEKEILFALVELNPTTTQRRNIITPGVWFQTKEITEQGDGRGNSKESFTEMDKYREGHHSKSSDLNKPQNIGEIDGEKKTLGGKGQHG